MVPLRVRAGLPRGVARGAEALPSRILTTVPLPETLSLMSAWRNRRKLVIATISDGLGNQLFHYAAGLGLARRQDAFLALDTSFFQRRFERDYLLDRFRIPDPVFIPAARRRGLSRRLWKAVPEPRLYQETCFEFDPGVQAQAAPVRIRGNFQCERHFRNVEAEIRARYQLRAPLSQKAEDVARRIATSPLPVSLHMRRGDYLKPSPHHYPLPLDYYRAADALLRQRLGAAPSYFVFSDDPAYAAEAFDFLGAPVFVEGDADRPEEDLILMSCCRHHVIANSTFSWWGAWLDPRPDKIVIGPRRWFFSDPANTSEVCPPSWHLL